MTVFYFSSTKKMRKESSDDTWNEWIIDQLINVCFSNSNSNRTIKVMLAASLWFICLMAALDSIILQPLVLEGYIHSYAVLKEDAGLLSELHKAPLCSWVSEKCDDDEKPFQHSSNKK